MTTVTLPTFLFDGDCGVCQNGTDAIRHRIDPPVQIVAFQLVDLADYGVTAQDVLEGPVLVRADGTHVVGPLGMAEMLRSSRRPFRQLGAAMLLPGVRSVLKAVGPVVYRQRGRLPGNSAACQAPAPN